MKTLALIDISGVFRANWAANEGQPINTSYTQTLERVTKLRQGFDHCAICIDSPPYRRKALFADYKGQRDKPAENMLGQFARVKQTLADQGLAVLGAAGYEADDIIATLVAQAVLLPTEERMAITVISADKDLLQLVNDADCVTAHSFATGVTCDAEAVRAKFGVGPSGMLDLLSLVGDAGDNVPGVRGVGPKTAALVVNSAPGLEGALAGEFIPGLTPRLAEAIADSAEGVRLARKLIALEADAPVSIADVFAKREVKAAKNGTRDLDGEAEGGIIDGEFEEIPDLSPAMKPEPVIAPAAKIASAPPIGASLAEKPKTAAPVAPKPVVSKTETTGLARVEPSFDMALEPRNNTAAFEMAKVFAQSGLYPKLPSELAVYVVIVRGRELGLTVGASLDNLSFFEGKVCMAAHLIIDRAKRHPDCEWFRFVGGDDTYAEYEAKVRGEPEPTRHRYTIAQAQQAGMCPAVIRTARPLPPEKDTRNAWEKRPAELLRKTTGVQLARICLPGAAQGLYATEELGGE